MKYVYNFEQEDVKRLAKLKKVAELIKAGRIPVKDNIFCHIVIGMMKERLLGFQEKEWAEVISLYPSEQLFQPAVEMGVSYEKIIRVRRLLQKIRQRIDLRGDASNQAQSNVELIKVIDSHNVEIERLLFGIIKQICDVASTFFENMYKAGISPNDTKAQEFLVEEMLGNPLPFYTKPHLKRKYVNEFHWMMMKALEEVLRNWENNVYMSFEEFLKGVIRKHFKGSRQAEHRRRLYEFLTRDDWLMDVLTVEEATLRHNKSLLNMVKELKQNPIYSNEDDVIWIEQVAKELNVTAQTLRNWDKKGIARAHAIIIDGKQYRGYRPEDIPKLKQVKYEQQRKRISAPRGCYKVGEVGKICEVHPDTIIRKEAKKQLPEPRRDKHNNRIYSIDDIKIIKKILDRS